MAISIVCSFIAALIAINYDDDVISNYFLYGALSVFIGIIQLVYVYIATRKKKHNVVNKRKFLADKRWHFIPKIKFKY